MSTADPNGPSGTCSTRWPNPLPLRWRLGTRAWPAAIERLPTVDLVDGRIGELRLGLPRLALAGIIGRPSYARWLDRPSHLTWRTLRLTVVCTRAGVIHELRLEHLTMPEPPIEATLRLTADLERPLSGLNGTALVAALGEPRRHGADDGTQTWEWIRPGWVIFAARRADDRIAGLGLTLPRGAMSGLAGVDWSP